MDENSSEKSDFSYFYGDEPIQYAFYRIPKVLITDKRFNISPEAKLLIEIISQITNGNTLLKLSVSGQLFHKESVAAFFSLIWHQKMVEIKACKRLSVEF